MKQIYYVIQTLLRGRGSNIIKIISLGLSLTMSILLFSRVAYEQSFDTCYKDYDNLYQIWSVFTVKGEKYPPQEQNCGPVAGAILENFPEQVEAATSTCYWKILPCTMATFVLMKKDCGRLALFSDNGYRGAEWQSGKGPSAA